MIFVHSFQRKKVRGIAKKIATPWQRYRGAKEKENRDGKQ